jgi:protein-S-isoprenylcysteine O-methyltransferase Ste14
MTSTIAALARPGADPKREAGRTGPSRARSLASTVATVGLVALFAGFAVAHVAHWRATGQPTGLAFATQELVLVGVFAARRRPFVVSSRPVDWLVALFGSYAGLLLRPDGNAVMGLDALWLALQVVAVVAGAACMLRLGRSFGVVAANRGIQCRGPYRLVRHPMYLAHLVSIYAYVLSSFTLRNAVVVALATTGQVGRIIAEERVLSADEAYDAYRRRVRHRLLPGVF